MTGAARPEDLIDEAFVAVGSLEQVAGRDTIATTVDLLRAKSDANGVDHHTGAKLALRQSLADRLDRKSVV